MKNTLNDFERLIALAEQEDCPAVDVAHQVMHRIEQSRPSYNRPLALVAMWSSAAAMFTAVISGYIIYSSADPLSPIFALASTMTP